MRNFQNLEILVFLASEQMDGPSYGEDIFYLVPCSLRLKFRVQAAMPTQHFLSPPPSDVFPPSSFLSDSGTAKVCPPFRKAYLSAKDI